MKVILDIAYTGLPSTCSSSYLAWEVMHDLAEWRDDIFFYLFYPAEVLNNEHEMEFLSRMSDRVTIIPIDGVSSDRKRAFWSMASDVYDMVTPGLHLTWDAEVLITSRIPQIPAYKHVTSKVGGWIQDLTRMVIGLEEMPMFSFRNTATAHPEQFDLMTYTSYRLSDGVIMNNLWTKKQVVKESRRHLTPGHIKEMGERIFEAVPLKLTPLHLRSNHDLSGDFNVVFTGRMTATRSFDKVLRLFTHTFVYDVGGKKTNVRYIVSTNSRSNNVKSAEVNNYVDIQMNDRDKFHALLKEKAHVVVNLSDVEDFSLSTYEPLLFGVPVIVANRPWTDFLGPDYPFRVEDISSGYAMLHEFLDNYEAMYAKFRQWEGTTWRKVISSEANTTTAQHLRRMLAEYDQIIDTWLTEPSRATGGRRGGKYLEVVEQIVDGKPEFIDLHEHFSQEYDELNMRRTAVGKRPAFHMLKRMVMLHGYKDVQQLGLLQRVEE